MDLKNKQMEILGMKNVTAPMKITLKHRLNTLKRVIWNSAKKYETMVKGKKS